MMPQKLLSLVLAFTLSLSSWAIDRNVQALVTYETKSNAVAKRSDEVVAIEHYEIPLEVVEKNLAPRLAPDIRNALIFNKDGVPHVRWIINPEDTKWHLKVEEFLLSSGLSAERHTHFKGYMTASRSYIIEDPITGAQFSAKVSTDKTGGNWRDKHQPIKDAEEIRMAADYVFEEMLKRPFEHVIPMDEPAMFGLRAIDQAMIIRVLADLPGSNKIYLPGFSAVHEKTGAEIARRNGANNPAAFWNKHYNEPLARALAEFAARTGLTYDSPHSQNFLIELTSDMKPTGRIVLRDFGDSYLLTEILNAKGRKEFVQQWEPDNVLKKTLSASVGILHGNTAPAWIPENVYRQWGKKFYAEFARELSRQTGIPVTELSVVPSQNGQYFSGKFDVTTPAWKEFLKRVSQERLSIVPQATPTPATTRLNVTSGNCALVFR